MSVRSGALRRTAETPVADRAPGPLSCRQPKMEFLLGNPFSTPVGQCLGKAARRTGLGGDGGGRRGRGDRGPLRVTVPPLGHPCRRALPTAGWACSRRSAVRPGGARGPDSRSEVLGGPLPSRPSPSRCLRSGAGGRSAAGMPLLRPSPARCHRRPGPVPPTWASASVPAAPSRGGLPAPRLADGELQLGRPQEGGDRAGVPEGGRRRGGRACALRGEKGGPAV